MKKKTLILGLILLFTLTVCADDLADWQYEQATAAYNVGDCKTAATHAEIAFERYSAAGDTPGITKTNDLIRKINLCLASMGDQIYIDTSDYIVSSDSFIASGRYEQALEQLGFAVNSLNSANSTYRSMLPPDSERIQKVNNKYQEVLDRIRVAEIMRADGLYKNAVEHKSQKDGNLAIALSYAQEAMDTYTRYGVQSKMQSTQELINAILKEIRDIKDNADYLYGVGMEEWEKATCRNEGFFKALENFEQANTLYVRIAEDEEIEKCAYVIGRMNEKIDECLDVLMGDVDILLFNATEQYAKAQKCEEYSAALETVNTALAALETISSRYKGRISRKVLSAKEEQCSDLKRDITKQQESCFAGDIAEQMLIEAQDLFEKAEYVSAREKAQEARKKHLELDDYAGVTRCDELIDKIDFRLSELEEGDGLYNQSLSYYEVADYENAVYYLEKAIAVYANLSRSAELTLCNETLAKIREGNDTKNRADKYYEEAIQFWEVNDVSIAKEKAQNAMSLYKKINYQPGVDKVQELLEQEVEPDPTPPLEAIAIAIAILMVIGVWMRSKHLRAAEKAQFEGEKKRDEEAKRLAELEEQRRSREAEKQRMIEERARIREMLDAEKKAVVTEEESDAIPETPKEASTPAASPDKEKSTFEEERTKLEAMLDEEVDFLKEEKAAVPPAPQKPAESDRDMLKEIIEREEEDLRVSDDDLAADVKKKTEKEEEDLDS